LDQDIKKYKRTHYSFFDLLSDIGGFQGILVTFLASLAGIWNHNMLDNYMVSRLYKLEKPNEDTRQIKDTFKESEFMKPRLLYNPKEYFRNLLPHWVCFCPSMKADRLEKSFEQARAQLQKETNMIEIIKSRRYFNAALRFLLSKT
jgi:hypothetical protein